MENRSLIKLLTDIIIFLTIVGLIAFVYQIYGERIVTFLYGTQQESVFIEDLLINVTYAVTPEERIQGLSGVTSLGELEGKLFFFDEEA